MFPSIRAHLCNISTTSHIFFHALLRERGGRVLLVTPRDIFMSVRTLKIKRGDIVIVPMHIRDWSHCSATPREELKAIS
ncbi:hypothetical protein PBY51_024581 [Eleginops maclovinus]|uniref:Uncharacterized protein n=1 Tax=Eleginops maclovinus TaxID=56733 RepID=A0AAN7Y060_ELEMC|nr:hypothetical protein PBY51_024581 [Eleginops maclovinus]